MQKKKEEVSGYVAMIWDAGISVICVYRHATHDCGKGTQAKSEIETYKMS